MTATSQWYQDNFFKLQVTHTPTRDTEPLSQATLVKMFAAYRAFFNRLCLCLYLYLCSISTEQTANNFISNWVSFVVKPTCFWLSLWWRLLCLDGVWSVPVRVVQGREAEVMQWHDHTIALQFCTGRHRRLPLRVFCWCLDQLQVCEYDGWWCGGALLHCNCITGGWTRRDSTLSVSLSPADINTAAPPPAPAARGTLQR